MIGKKKTPHTNKIKGEEGPKFTYIYLGLIFSSSNKSHQKKYKV